MENGLPQSSVTELVRDSACYVWGATFGGLFRFDGRAILHYSASDLPALGGNPVTALAVAPNGTLVGGTPDGLIARLERGQLVDSLPAPSGSLPNQSIDGLLAIGTDEVWARRGEFVRRRWKGRWEPAQPFAATTSLVRDGDGRLLYAGPAGIVRVARNGTASLLSPRPRPELGREYGLHLDAGGRLWVGSADGLWLYEEGRGARRIGGLHDVVSGIVSDLTGTVWFTAGEKLYRYAASATDRTPQAVLDARARLVSVVRTNDGLLLLGSLEGMLLVRPNAIRVVESRRAIPSIETGSLASRGDGTVWLTSSCSDVLRIVRHAKVIDSIARPATPGCTRSLAHDARGRLWVGGDGAIRRRAPDGTERLWRLDSLRPDVAIRPLVAAGDSLLFGTGDGRVGIVGPDDRLRWLPGWSQPAMLPVESMTMHGETLWIAQRQRLTRVHRGRQVRFDAHAGLPNAVPRALLADGTGTLWIGTYGAGLWAFRPGTQARQVPVPHQTISAIILGPNERIWMPGNRGLSVVPARSLRRWALDSATPPDVRLLSFEDGVPEGNLGAPAAVEMAPGVLAFASVTGLVVAQAADVATAGTTPVVQVDALRSGTQALRPENGRYRVDPAERALYAAFSMPSFRFDAVAQFRYRLHDSDPWIALGSTRELPFTVSAPGRYVLTIEGRVPGGEWVRASPVSLDVLPLFGERLWPRVLTGLVLGVMLAVLARQRLRAKEATARAREVELQARREAAEQAERHQRQLAQVSRVAVAGELTASLSHELGQPLAAIVNNAEVARRLLARQGADGRPEHAAVEEALLDVVAQGRRASQVVREFRRFLAREHGERERITVAELIGSAALLLRQEYAHGNVTLDIGIAARVPVLYGERVLLQQALVNLLQNAYEAARRGTGGRVLVRAKAAGEGVRISVVDDGPGFAPHVRPTAFVPFVTTRRDGMGIGLAIARRLVEAHGGRIGIGQLRGAGAVVSLLIPARREAVDVPDPALPLLETTHA